MNIISETWIPVFMQNGERTIIAPWQITEEVSPIMELSCTRPDFQGALYQLLIGLLQTCYAPDDEEQWLEKWQSPPSKDDLKLAFMKVSQAFELTATEGPAFLQDFDLLDGEQKNISALLIDSPGGKTLKDNLDFFVKGGQVKAMCESCAATALFTLQTNAPSGGVGHRVGLRGGGPLTTLILPQFDRATLWQKLWLNVLPLEYFNTSIEEFNSEIFPWLAPTRLSDKKGVTTTPTDVHPFQMYWGMPRRIRLDFESICSGTCDLCGAQSENLFSTFKTKNYGVNYDGPWVHRLTPYRFDPKNKELPLSLKGQQGGLGYRHWIGLSYQDDSNGDKAASVVDYFNHERGGNLEDNGEEGGLIARLWCFGYDMDNMKARCWYDHQMPVLKIDPEYRDQFIGFVGSLIGSAKDTVYLLRSQIKVAWFSRPKDVKGDMSMIDQSFWQETEPGFYLQLKILAKQPINTRTMPVEVAQAWMSILRSSAYNLFDQWVIESDLEDMDMKRIIRARQELKRKFNSLKSIKLLKQIAESKEKEAM